MKVKVGTYNLNNLFSRYNFKGTISKTKSGTDALTVSYEFTDQGDFRIRKFMGRLVKAKKASDTSKIAQRILDLDLDVLAVQEVENINILKEFNRDKLNGLYDHIVLIEGNDPRLIDVGIMSKLPLGAVGSFQTSTHPSEPNKRIFGRDLLEVQVYNQSRTMRLFTIYNNHLKSKFGNDGPGGPGTISNDIRRTKQAEVVQQIVAQRMAPDARFIITGDMNDTPEAQPLQAMLTISGNALFNGLENPTEIGAMKDEQPGNEPASTAWTLRFRPSGQPPEHHLVDQIWLSPALQPAFSGGFIKRRYLLSGEGSDHDPAWVELDL